MYVPVTPVLHANCKFVLGVSLRAMTPFPSNINACVNLYAIIFVFSILKTAFTICCVIHLPFVCFSKLIFNIPI